METELKQMHNHRYVRRDIIALKKGLNVWIGHVFFFPELSVQFICVSIDEINRFFWWLFFSVFNYIFCILIPSQFTYFSTILESLSSLWELNVLLFGIFMRANKTVSSFFYFLIFKCPKKVISCVFTFKCFHYACSSEFQHFGLLP